MSTLALVGIVAASFVVAILFVWLLYRAWYQGDDGSVTITIQLNGPAAGLLKEACNWTGNEPAKVLRDGLLLIHRANKQWQEHDDVEIGMYVASAKTGAIIERRAIYFPDKESLSGDVSFEQGQAPN